MKINYSSLNIPRKYKCNKCGATGCKLWREYQTFSPILLCAPCAAKDQNKSLDGIDKDGQRLDKYGFKTDQIGWYVPAVPDEQGIGYWGYTTIPKEGCIWWRQLPSLPQEIQVK